MSTEQDAGTNGKKTLSVIFLGIVIAAAFGYWFLSWRNSDSTAAVSSVNLSGVARTSGATTPETPRYRELLRTSNDIGAQEAMHNNTSFIASLPVGLDTPQEDTKKNPPPPVTPTHRPLPPPADRGSVATRQQDNEKRKEVLQKLLARISNAHGGSVPVLASLRKTMPDTPTPTTHTAPAGTLPPEKMPAQLLVPALTRVPASLETAVNSDNPSPQVIAVIPAGELAGARLHSASVKMAGEGVAINFRKMSWRGMDLNINAWAQQEDTLDSSVASEVNHRWVSHIILPAVLGGLGDIGSLYKDANTQILQTNVSTVTGKVGKPDGETVAGVILGGTAQKGAEVVSQEMTREPFRQVRVKQNEVISILFVDAVTTDNLTNKKSGITATPDTPTAPLAAAENRTEERLQASIARRQAAIRRQYGSD